jgi:hypothetical protein
MSITVTVGYRSIRRGRAIGYSRRAFFRRKQMALSIHEEISRAL